MEEDHKYGTNHKGNIRVKTIFAVIFALTLEAAFVFSATVMGQEDLPIEATWQKHRPQLRTHFLGMKVIRLQLYCPRTDNSMGRRCTVDCLQIIGRRSNPWLQWQCRI